MKVLFLVVMILSLFGCIATPKQLTNRLEMSVNTSLSIKEIKLLEKYNINTSEDLKFALNQASKYGFTANYWGIINLEKAKKEATKKGVSITVYLAEERKKKLEKQKDRNKLLSKLKANKKFDNSLNLTDEIYLTCSRISKRPIDGATTRSFSYVTLRNKTIDYIEIYNKWNPRVAGQINKRETFFEKPILVTKFNIKVSKNNKGYSDRRNNLTINRNSLKLTHNEYLSYGGSTKPFYPNNVYSFNCNFSEEKIIEWQKKTFEIEKNKKLKEKQLTIQRLENKLKNRKF